MLRFLLFYVLILFTGCTNVYKMSPEFVPRVIETEHFQIATWQRVGDATSSVHVYIEGDGHAFDAYGRPTSNPTPRGNLVRQLAERDPSPNVVYIARPCQYVTDAHCSVTDWTTGRFSARVIDSVANAITVITSNRPVVLIGYSGGAIVSGIIISRHPEIHTTEWVTIAGVINHHEWTEYFGDTSLTDSLNLNELPNIPTRHYIAESDNVVPYELSMRWLNGKFVVVPHSTHDKFPNLNLF
ncbi:MAG: hypothetical protein IJ560_00825 [Alphaproteobacteria bacterium]|nr:hypothetical protein [Alphaproteobacteria bacterium]